MFYRLTVAVGWQDQTWSLVKVETTEPEIEWRDESKLGALVEEQCEEVKNKNVDIAFVTIYDVSEADWSVSHAQDGDLVKDGFDSQHDAYEWLKEQCRKEYLEPADINAYVVEPSCDDD